MGMEDKFQRLLAWAEKREKERPEASTEPTEEASEALVVKEKKANVVSLPVWPEPARGVPNDVVRSALFGIIRPGRRQYIEGEKIPIPAINGLTIVYSGPRLDQADLDVWLQCLHLAREQALGTQIYFRAHSFLKAIGRSTGKSQHEWLKGTFRRLMGAVVEIEAGGRTYAGQLVHDWYRDDETKEHVIVLNPRLIGLFADDGWTGLRWGERLALKRQQLAQWLHAFYSTHADPYPMKVETIRRLCGSENEQLFHFREKLRKALVELEKTTGWSCWIDENDLVHVVKRGKKALPC